MQFYPCCCQMKSLNFSLLVAFFGLVAGRNQRLDLLTNCYFLNHHHFDHSTRTLSSEYTMFALFRPSCCHQQVTSLQLYHFPHSSSILKTRANAILCRMSRIEKILNRQIARILYHFIHLSLVAAYISELTQFTKH